MKKKMLRDEKQKTRGLNICNFPLTGNDARATSTTKQFKMDRKRITIYFPNF
jgi:hypothetical protein